MFLQLGISSSNKVSCCCNVMLCLGSSEVCKNTNVKLNEMRHSYGALFYIFAHKYYAKGTQTYKRTLHITIIPVTTYSNQVPVFLTVKY